jgi:hypothetical protein
VDAMGLILDRAWENQPVFANGHGTHGNIIYELNFSSEP